MQRPSCYFKNSYRSFKVNSYTPFKRWTTTWVHILWLSFDFTSYIFGVFWQKFFTLLHFLYFYLNFLCRSDGTLNGAPYQGYQPPWHAEDRFTGFRWRVGSWGPPGKLQNFKTDHMYLIVAAVTWLKYCRYGVKLYPINQSINSAGRHVCLYLNRQSHFWCTRHVWTNLFLILIRN